MFRIALVSLLAVAATFLTDIAARAQQIDDEKAKQAAIARQKTRELLEKADEEYRVFFKRPKTTIEYWAAIKFEMDLGKFDLAALHLKRMLGNDPDVKTDPADVVDKDLVKLEEAEGMSAFLRLKKVRDKDWSDFGPFQKEARANVEGLIDRVTNAVEKHLSDPDRIKKYIARLDAQTPEERAYSYVQLARSRERAVPYLIQALRVSFGKSLYPRVRETLLRLGPESVPAYLEAFKAMTDEDYRDLEMRLALLDLVRERDDKRVIPYLWHMHASKKYPEPIRKRAKEVLASLLRLNVEQVPDAKQTLTWLAEQHYQHKIPFKEEGVKIWPWDGQALAIKPVQLSPHRAEEYFGMKFAREALDLDPGYRPAQIVLLSFELDRYYRPKLDQILSEPMPPKMQQLLTNIDAELAIDTLERAMEDGQIPVILPLIQALGERGEFRAARLGTGGQPRGLIRALYYPDRRVQFAAALAMLRMPPTVVPAVASTRIVDLAKRFLNSEMKSKALLVQVPVGAEAGTRKVVANLGYEPVLAKSVKEAIDLGKSDADFDLVVLHRGINEQDFAHVYAQLRQNYDLGGLPMIVVVDKKRERAIKQFTASNPNAVVVSEGQFKTDADLKAFVDAHVKKVELAKLTPEERTLFSRVGMDTLWRMAKGEIKGYDISPAFDAIVKQLDSKDYGFLVLEIMGNMPGRDIQYRLATIVGDPARDLKMRLPAAFELNRHMQKNGVLIAKKQQDELRIAQKQAPDGTPLKMLLNVTASMMSRPDAARTGADLTRFRPDPPPPPKQKEEK